MGYKERVWVETNSRKRWMENCEGGRLSETVEILNGRVGVRMDVRKTRVKKKNKGLKLKRRWGKRRRKRRGDNAGEKDKKRRRERGKLI